MVEEWTRLSGAKTPAVCFSPRDGSNFRKHLDPTYKAGRPEKPAAYWEIVDAIEARFKVHRVDSLEADDVMGIAGTNGRWESVIVSLDKDMQTIPGRVFNPTKDARPRQVTTAQADLFWMTQTLTGDPVDGYKGCPKVGPVNAARILAPHVGSLGGMWSAVVDAYALKGLPPEYAITQARLARILRSTDYDRANKEIKLWHLTKPETLALGALTAPLSTSADAPTTPASASVAGPGAKRSSAGRSRRKA